MTLCRLIFKSEYKGGSSSTLCRILSSFRWENLFGNRITNLATFRDNISFHGSWVLLNRIIVVVWLEYPYFSKVNSFMVILRPEHVYNLVYMGSGSSYLPTCGDRCILGIMCVVWLLALMAWRWMIIVALDICGAMYNLLKNMGNICQLNWIVCPYGGYQ